MRVSVGMVLWTIALLGCQAGNSGTIKVCVPNAPIACSCGASAVAMTMCLADGSGTAPCPCNLGAAGAAGTIASAGRTGGVAGTAVVPPVAGASGATGAAGTRAGSAGILGASGTSVVAQAGRPGTSGMTATAGRTGTSGMNASAGANAAGSGAAGNISGLSDSDLDMLRQTCVDTINMYRATLSGLMPLKRASAAQEACSDTGATYDGMNKAAHGYARMSQSAFPDPTCRTMNRLFSEDTCPDWGVGGFSGNATVADALKNCLQAMWNEGPPPSGTTVQQCEMDQSATGCYETHGHYINMSDSMITIAACSFYHMSDGNYWMNQDFGN